MQAVVATVFWVLLLPHEGRIVTIDQLSFSRPDPSLGVSTVLMIENPQPGMVNVGVGLCHILWVPSITWPLKAISSLYPVTIRLIFSSFIVPHDLLQ
jgi:hypothetical protein